jgi:CRISPR-associated protein Csb1
VIETALYLAPVLADAIRRDSQIDAKPFRNSDRGKAPHLATFDNATPILELCPTALVFGMWDSTRPSKNERGEAG